MNINMIVRMVKKGVEGLADNRNLTDVVAFIAQCKGQRGRLEECHGSALKVHPLTLDKIRDRWVAYQLRSCDPLWHAISIKAVLLPHHSKLLC